MAGVAIIAGAGLLPQLLVRACADSPHTVVAFDGVDGLDWEPQTNRVAARFEQPGALFDALKSSGHDTVVFAGAMNRPPLDPTKFDATLLAYAPKLMLAMGQGDDAVLSIVVAMFADAGFRIARPEDIAPDLTASPGVLTQSVPTAADRKDVARASEIVAALGALDIGQGAVVAQGLCLATEALPGTDAMLQGLAHLDRARLPNPSGAAGVLYKAPKPGQSRAVDLPAVGMRTVELTAQAGLAGIAFEAHGALLIDKSAMIDAANDAGLFLWSRDPSDT